MAIVYGLRRPGGPIRYIGQTSKSLKDRLSAHKYWAIKRNSPLPVHAWMRKHKDVEAVVLVASAQLNLDEIAQIALAKAAGAELLNCTDGGSGASGWKASDETRLKISKGRSGIANPRAVIDAVSRSRRALSDGQVQDAKKLKDSGMSYAKVASALRVSASTVQSAIKMLRPCYCVCTTQKTLGTQDKLKETNRTDPLVEAQRKEDTMDEKTQKLIDKAVKAARKDVIKAVNTAIADAATSAGELEGAAEKKAVKAALRDLKTAVKDATAE